ncbi:cell division protein FtsQ/DivIB [Desulfopila sp. IMCC35008]|uniref:cell division protein FtsQ/DivIB n=1 Tax=Desulfopila sp. IMCC35008 TaxID=2653858 RepID=UPI0013D1AA5F|nr:FtsQ-type POTRA domain-containing protein [Desulfopila sp. IMCC35008]
MKNKLATDIRKNLQVLIMSLRGKGKDTSSNSELPKSAYCYDQQPVGKRTRFSLEALRNRITQKRRLRKESFASPARGKEVKKKIRPYAAICLVLLLFLACNGPSRVGYLLKDISKFKVRRLVIEGGSAVTVKRIKELSGITLYKTSLLELDIQKISKRLEQEPWVKSAEVSRDWPSGVVVDVTEYKPVALVNVSTEDNPQLYYIDKKGNTFLRIDPGQDVDYPVITGLDMVTDKKKRQEIFSDIMTFLVRARRNNPNLPAQSVSELHINRQEEMVLYLVDHPFPIFFGKGNIEIKFYRLLRVMESLYREKKSSLQLAGVQYIRMDYFNDKVLVAQSDRVK